MVTALYVNPDVVRFVGAVHPELIQLTVIESQTVLVQLSELVMVRQVR